MKKVKIMLTAFAVFAVVGGSLAFKAQKINAIVYTGTSSTSCPTQIINKTFTSAVNGSKVYVTDNSAGTGCLSSYLTPQD
jgi:hypothetical protein